MTDQTNEQAVVEQTPNASSDASSAVVTSAEPSSVATASDASNSAPVTGTVADTATTDEADVPESESLLESIEHVVEEGIEALKKLVE
jgi:hypothetical protein